MQIVERKTCRRNKLYSCFNPHLFDLGSFMSLHCFYSIVNCLIILLLQNQLNLQLKHEADAMYLNTFFVLMR